MLRNPRKLKDNKKTNEKLDGKKITSCSARHFLSNVFPLGFQEIWISTQISNLSSAPIIFPSRHLLQVLSLFSWFGWHLHWTVSWFLFVFGSVFHILSRKLRILNILKAKPFSHFLNSWTLPCSSLLSKSRMKWLCQRNLYTVLSLMLYFQKDKRKRLAGLISWGARIPERQEWFP